MDGQAWDRLQNPGRPPGHDPSVLRFADGSGPNSILLGRDGYLYGVTAQGGRSDRGTVFRLHPDGHGFSTLFEFDGLRFGGNPSEIILGEATTLYVAAAARVLALSPGRSAPREVEVPGCASGLLWNGRDHLFGVADNACTDARSGVAIFRVPLRSSRVAAPAPTGFARP